MQVEISITIPPDRSLAKFKMDGRLFSGLLEIFRDVLGDPKNNIQQRLDKMEKEMSSDSSDSDPLSRLENVISPKQASDFKAILQKNGITERAVCTKYGVDCIEELTGSDVLDVLTGIVLSNQDKKAITHN